MLAYKLLRRRRDGSLGPLFIHSSQRLPVGVWLRAHCYPTPGFAIRPGWHATQYPTAPHLTKEGRVWALVDIDDVTPYSRPAVQGGLWFTARNMRIIDTFTEKDVECIGLSRKLQEMRRSI